MNLILVFFSVFNLKRKHTETNQYFYDMSPIEEKEKQKRTKTKIEFDTNKCWFCLASPSVEKHLIISVGNNAYLALAKGKTLFCNKTLNLS